jgi:hypothetical protein
MKHISRLILTLALVAILALSAVGFTSAQDMMTHTCDSTLITLLLIAEYEYGFHSEMMDLATFDKGQYAPFFEAMMMMEEEMMDDEGMMEATEMPEGEMTEMPMDDMMMLPVGTIEGEDEACTALREELDAFLYSHFTSMMMEMEAGQ